jgi:ABC-2 type transport system permease protein
MTGALATFRKELLSYCCSPVSYLIAVLFYLWRGFEVYRIAVFCYLAKPDPDQFPTWCYGQNSTYMMVVLVPAVLTMRCFAEERRTGSIETLMTAPVGEGGVVVGKWLAATVFYALLWLPSVLVLALLQPDAYLGTDLAFGPVFAAYLGMFLLSSMLLAFGCFASSLTDNLLLAALLAIVFNFGLIQGPGLLSQFLGELRDDFYVAEVLRKLDVMANFSEWFARGLIDSSQVAFYLGGVLFFLFLCALSLRSRRIA